MAMWMMAVEDKSTPWMQRCSGVYDINVIWKDFMETFAKVADHIVGRRPKSKPIEDRGGPRISRTCRV